MHRHSTINTQSLACDVSSIWQTEKGDGGCNFIGSTKASQRGAIKHEFALLFCDIRSEFCWHKAWCDRIGSDIATSHLASCTQRQGDNSCFRCTVVSLSSGPQQPGY